jgi:N-methylhydantoinase A
MRYMGQGHEIAVPVPGGELTETAVAELKSAFEAEYSRLYSRTVPGEAELLTWVVKISTASTTGTGGAAAPADSYAPEPAGERRVFDPEQGGFITAAVFERERLRPGASFRGPAIVVESETTTVVSGRFDVRLNGFGYLECTRIQ